MPISVYIFIVNVFYTYKCCAGIINRLNNRNKKCMKDHPNLDCILTSTHANNPTNTVA